MKINHKNIVLFEASDPFKKAYAMFGLKPGASKKEIADVYRKMYRQVHPDLAAHHGLTQRESIELAQKIQASKDILIKDLERKKAYDKGGMRAVKAFDSVEGKHTTKAVTEFPDATDPFKSISYIKDVFTDPFVFAGKKLRRRLHDKFKFDPNSTENEGRWRLKDPKFFFKYFRLKSKTPGVSYIMGKNKKTGRVEVQAIRFDKRKISERQAARWWEKNKQRFRKEWVW